MLDRRIIMKFTVRKNKISKMVHNESFVPSICKELAHKMGGNIKVESNLSKPLSMKGIFHILYKYRNSKNTGNQQNQADNAIIIKDDYDDIDAVISRLVNECCFNYSEASAILNDYIRSLPDECVKLEMFLMGGKFTESKNLLHTLKGSAGNLRMSILYSLLSEFETSLWENASNVDLTYLKRFKNYVLRILKRN